MTDNELIELEVEGMTCTNCALSVQRYLEKNGGEEVSVNFATREVRFRNTADKQLKEIKKGISGLGYTVVEKQGETVISKRKLGKLEKLFLVSLLFTLPLLLHMFLSYPLFHDPYFQLVLSLPVMFIGFYHFGRSAFNSIRNGIANMDVLIFIGSTAAFVYSLAGTLMHGTSPEAHQYLFYETAATIITLVLLGNLIEERSVQKTTNALRFLTNLQQEKARIITSNAAGEEEIKQLPYDQVLAGDILLAANGDKILADGVVTSGQAEVDESAITGESSPEFKEEGSRIISGSVVTDGSLRYKAQRTGKLSTLTRIIELVKDAQSKKPAIQKLGDKVSAVFVPVVLGIAALTFVLSYFAFGISAQQALMSSIAVLVISCPCAMGLATPTAVMVGVGRGAKNGILIKGGSTIEELARLKTVVFDKTGTLTNGQFRVKNFESYLYDETVAKNIIFHMEKISSHPIARSITEDYKDWYFMRFEYKVLREEKGKGIYAEDASGNTFSLGSPAFTGEAAAGFDKDILLTYCGKVVAGFDIEDRLKPGAKETIAQLHAMGIKTVLLSGDNEKKCRFVAERTGITEMYHSQLPEQKLEIIQRLKTAGKTAMVGDGINDAPALAQADIGISMSQATDIAQQSASVVLMGDGIQKVGEAIRLGRITYGTIRQNLFWALFYNILAIPVAAAGLLVPMVGALSMAFSDVIVIGNSLRLNFRKIKP